ncbi:MAG: hypothetical protein JSV04_08400, partial [Candidatus Heimdallarchaeota archaeon]
MIHTLSSQQYFTIMVLGLAILFNLFSTLMVLKRNPRDNGNRFTSLAYLSFAIALTLYIVSVLIIDEAMIVILSSVATFFGMLAVIH